MTMTDPIPADIIGPTSQAIPARKCARCGGLFTPRRATARYCGTACRVAAHRGTDCNANSAAESAREAAPASQNGSEVHPTRSGPITTPAATKPLSVTRGYAIVPDAKWPGMYRIRRPDGSLSDIANLTRAKDALTGASI
jgi:hypothetical protein